MRAKKRGLAIRLVNHEGLSEGTDVLAAEWKDELLLSRWQEGQRWKSGTAWSKLGGK